ncbi:HEAT repeat domain-containing protein [candidate division KSB1 bacterium]|nr:HEAT repeat domain-containing protein [candidate division KSB1 bacterium]
MSTCSRHEKNIILLVYDELTEVDRSELEAHLAVCPACRQQLAILQTWRSAASRFSISDDILLPTRRALLYKLRSETAPKRSASWWSITRPVLQAGLAILLIFFGFKLGQLRPTVAIDDLLTATRAIALDDGTISPYLIGIDKITIRPGEGSVQISYNTMNDVRIEGGSDDPAVKQLLTYALSDDDISLRLRAVKALEQLTSFSRPLDESYMNALGQILAEEENVGIKLSVIKILATTSTAHSQDLLVRSMLQDEDEAVRIQAFKSLVHSRRELSVLDEVLLTAQTDSNAYIRTKSLQLLMNRKETSL